MRTPGVDRAYSVVLRHGFTDDVLKPGMARDVVARIELSISKGSRDDGNGDLDELRRAHEAQVVYVLGKEAMRIKKNGHNAPALIRNILLWMFLWLREKSRTKLADVDKVVEVGFKEVPGVPRLRCPTPLQWK